MKISQEAREAALVLRDYVAIRGLKDGQIERSMQSLINSTLERAAGVAQSYCDDASKLNGDYAEGLAQGAETVATAIRQLIEE